MAISKWSWDASNGKATAEQTSDFGKVFAGELPANSDNLSHKVWNDLVDKVYELIVETKATSSGTWDPTYGGYTDTYCYAGDTLSAQKFNAVRQNINRVCTKVFVNSLLTEGVGKVDPEQEILGSYITKAAEKINEIIENGW